MIDFPMYRLNRHSRFRRWSHGELGLDHVSRDGLTVLGVGDERERQAVGGGGCGSRIGSSGDHFGAVSMVNVG